MRKRTVLISLSILALAAASLACGFSATTANISDAWLSTDPEGQSKTTVFAPDQPFYMVANLKNAPDDTTVKASWYLVEAEGMDPNQLIDEAEITGGDNTLYFDLTSEQLWPVGKYKVDLYIDDELSKTLEFEVQ